ncbi:ATP synthase assembly factor-like protein [Hapsidospora chrysogenum ATCC 11550]|uniref:ATP synthase assembly factor-like protein n=1 Tax=Hapsidospora chrysogenum (strain ATCC 11550 / CBS 779.69 / DSM 880 / IAM 14645 / JCM 23072 / IMI 49137) TaxID=857340 RepID=A0A086T3G4_HAPC1|nr:ATP synthase assembly factor-like protein [Hapsidospora chrysogenum ATCC 11550]
MATTSAPRLRSLYRSLLRELPPRPILRSPRSSLHTRLRDSFSSSSSSSSKATTTIPAAAIETARAEQLVQYLRSQRSYVALVERYNPGMNMEDEERIRLTARRVGMDLPQEYLAKKD